MKKLLPFLSLLTFLFLTFSALADGVLMYDVKSSTIIMIGEIYDGEFQEFVQLYSSIRPAPQKVFVDGPGGNFLAGVNIGVFIHDNGLDTYTGHGCFSSCANIWLGGKNRYRPWLSEIGIHLPFDPYVGSTDFATVALNVYYYAKIGLDYSIVDDIVNERLEHGLDVLNISKYMKNDYVHGILIKSKLYASDQYSYYMEPFDFVFDTRGKEIKK